MKLTQLEVGARSFYLLIDDADQVMAAAAGARDDGKWLDFFDAGGEHWRVLVPHDAVLVVHDIERDDADTAFELNDWMSYDYDI